MLLTAGLKSIFSVAIFGASLLPTQIKPTSCVLFLQGAAAATVIAMSFIIAWDASGLDVMTARLFGGANGFSLHDQWFLTVALHTTARWIAWGVAIWITAGIWIPTASLRVLPRGQRIRWAASIWTSIAVVTLLKATSTTSCPWNLTLFGGTGQYFSHWSSSFNVAGEAHCFPAGHAASGFAFLYGYFAFRPTCKRRARRWLLGALAVGGILGLSQQMRGAHFMSHTFWTAWICWATAWLWSLKR